MMIHATARTVGPDGFRAAIACRRPGFSLTELLIAIGVLGIGLGMVAALFVTGLAQVRMSLGDSEGGMVAQNGIAVAKMFLKAGNDVSGGNVISGGASTLTDTVKSWGVDDWQDYHVRITGGVGSGQIRKISTNTATTLTVSTPWTIVPDATSTYVVTSGVPSESLVVVADETNTTEINADFQKYPYLDGTSKGFVILARQAGSGSYQLVSIAYAKTAGGTVTAETVTTTAAYDNATEITFTSSTNLNVGSPVIVTTSQDDVVGDADAVAGDYAMIVSLSGAVATLDHGLTIGNGATAYVVVESGGGSPATGVCITKTGLKP